MKQRSATMTSKGQLVIPAELRRKHGIKAGTKVHFLEDDLGRIVLAPVTEEYINSLMGCLKGGSDYLAIWRKEHRAEGKRADAKLRSRLKRSVGVPAA